MPKGLKNLRTWHAKATRRSRNARGCGEVSR
jgi:hypothetical protein